MRVARQSLRKKTVSPRESRTRESIFAGFGAGFRSGCPSPFSSPWGFLSLYFHFQLNVTLKESGKLHLTTPRNEREQYDRSLLAGDGWSTSSTSFTGTTSRFPPHRLTCGATSSPCREASDAFVDVGFLDASGRQIGYAGPYPYLHGEDYSQEPWFQTLMGQGTELPHHEHLPRISEETALHDRREAVFPTASRP